MTALPATTTLDLELDKGWLTIWLNQPEKRNALTSELTDELVAVLQAVRDDRTVRGITLRGRGGVYCAGGDLKSFKAGMDGSATRDSVIDMSCGAGAMFASFNSMPQVTISLIEGAAMAGGFGLACCSDVVICDASAKFALTETMIGLSPAQISPYVIQKLGYPTARRLMLTAARFDGEAAQKVGFADFVGASVSELEEVEVQIRKQVLKCSPKAVAETKALILALPKLSSADAIQAAAENFTDLFLSDEGREGVASFVEKRKPYWANAV